MNPDYTDLITVPTFTFNQGDPFAGEGNVERPIQVSFYNGSIELKQDGEFDNPETIILNPDCVDKLFRAIKKHRGMANDILNK